MTNQTVIELSVAKAKVGPITKRYKRGEFREVKREIDGKKVYAVCGLDNSHNGDYKVAYASDPLLVVQPNTSELTHGELKEMLESHGLWLDEFHPIWVPDPQKGWRPAFKSLPRSKNRLSLFQARMEKVVDREHDLIEGDNSVHAFLPVGE